MHPESVSYTHLAEVCDRILEEFGVKPGPHSHIINGHVPVSYTHLYILYLVRVVPHIEVHFRF